MPLLCVVPLKMSLMKSSIVILILPSKQYYRFVTVLIKFRRLHFRSFRYVTSVAGQTCSFSGKAAKGGSQYLCLNENV